MPEQTREFATLVQAIAEHLPEWTYSPPDEAECDDPPRLRHSDGRYICIWAEGDARLEIRGGWPKYDGRAITPYELRAPTPRITVLLARGPEKIAREIERRFLPAYTALWERATAKVAEYEERERKLTATQERICKALGEALPRDRYSLHFPDGWGSVEVSSPDTITIELHSLPVDLALAIIAAMREQLGGA